MLGGAEAGALPNLVPYQPPGWSAPIVVSTTTGTSTDSATLRSTDTLYIDWAVVNFGNVGATSFSTRLFVDGSTRQTWLTASLATNFYTSISDFSLGSLSAGQHTIVIIADVFGVITESNENDNRYERTITVTAPPTVPVSPTGLQAVGSSGRIVMNWNDNSNNETGFRIERKLGAGGSWGLLASTGANQNAYQDSPLSNGLTYYYRVYAYNSAGNSPFYTNEACATTLASPSLTSPNDGASFSTGSVTLQWNSVTGATGYGLDVGSSCGGTNIVNGLGLAATSYVLSNLSAGQYFWRVKAANGTCPGLSDPSTCRSFVVNLGPTATWITPPPSSVTVGQTFQVAWQTTGNPTHVNIHWDPDDPTLLTPDQVVDGSTRNSTVSPNTSPYTLTAPTIHPNGSPITGATITKYVVHVRNSNGDGFSEVVPVTITINVPTPDIDVSPTTLAFTCTASASGIANDSTVNLSDRLGNAEPKSQHPADGKLLQDTEIMQRFAAGAAQVRVIVNLRPPLQRLAVNWGDPISEHAMRGAIRRYQDEVLNRVTGNDCIIRHIFENQPGFSAVVTPVGLEALQADPAVQSIEFAREVVYHGAQGIPLINGIVYRSTYGGSGVAIVIVDSGVDYTHPRLGGGSFPNSKVIGGYDFNTMTSNPHPGNTHGIDAAHGTACAGIAAGNLGTVGNYIGGVAPDAKLYALKMEPTFDSGVAAINWSIMHRNDDPVNPILVINNSWGLPNTPFASPCDAYSPSMTTAINNAVVAGITVLFSSGNDGFCNGISWPSCISNVISVGAVYDASIGSLSVCVSSNSCASPYSCNCPSGWCGEDATTSADRVTVYSNAASILDVLAPSHNAYTTDIIGSHGYSSGDYNGAFGGTSAACPYAAGAVAALQSASKAINGSYLTPQGVRSSLVSTGVPVLDAKSNITKPRVNLGSAIDALGGDGCSGQTLAIENIGQDMLIVPSVSKPAWAQLNPPPPYQIAGGQSTAVCVTVDCGACSGGDLSGTIALNSNDPDEPTVNVPISVACIECTVNSDCNDGNSCTSDLCSDGFCSNPFLSNGTPCPDDGNPCKYDVCNGTGSCTHPNRPNGTSCPSNGAYCDGVESCQSGACIPPGDPCPSGTTCDEPTQTCPLIRELLSCSPEHCNIDARIAHDRLNAATLLNIDTVIAHFSSPTAEMTAADFEVMLFPNNPGDVVPGVDTVTPTGNSATILLDRRIQQTRWTCIRDIGSNQRCCLGSLPADADNSRISQLDDVFEIYDNLQGIVNPVLAIEKCDTDRSGLCTPADLLMALDLLNGVDAFIEVNGDTLPLCPSIVP